MNKRLFIGALLILLLVTGFYYFASPGRSFQGRIGLRNDESNELSESRDVEFLDRGGFTKDGVNFDEDYQGIFSTTDDEGIVVWPLVAGTVKQYVGRNVPPIPVPDASVQLYYNMEVKDENGLIKVYRIGLEPPKITDSLGEFSFSFDEFEKYFSSKVGNIVSPYPLYLIVQKEGYMDSYVFDANKKAKFVNFNETWNPEIFLYSVPSRLTEVKDKIKVSYYPGQEECRDVAFKKIGYFYSNVSTLLGIEPLFSESNPFAMTFNNSWEQGTGDWYGSPEGIATICHPWTSNLDILQVEDMWNSVIPHEISHTFLAKFHQFFPYWVDEGLAQYASKKLMNEKFDCNTLLPVQDLKGEDTSYYEAAACFFYLMDEKYPNFTYNMMKYIKSQPSEGLWVYGSTKNFIDDIIPLVLSTNYDIASSKAWEDINEFMKQFSYDPNKL